MSLSSIIRYPFNIMVFGSLSGSCNKSNCNTFTLVHNFKWYKQRDYILYMKYIWSFGRQNNVINIFLFARFIKFSSAVLNISIHYSCCMYPVQYSTYIFESTKFEIFYEIKWKDINSCLVTYLFENPSRASCWNVWRRNW